MPPSATKSKKKRTKKPLSKTTVEIVHGITIREVRPGYFLVRVRREGKQHSETFASIEAARMKCEQLHNEEIQHGLSAFEIDPKTRAEAKAASQMLNGRASLSEAAAFWLKHHPDGGSITVSELVSQYVADLERRKMRPHTIGDARRRLNRFAVDHGEAKAGAITAEDLTTWLSTRGGSPLNSNNYRKQIKAAFNFGVKRGLIELNPVDKVDSAKVDRTVPVHWPAVRVQNLLRAAQLFSPSMIPVLSIMAFAGLRPDEAARLDWANVNLTERHIRVMPETSKIRAARLVEISENLAAWLKPHRKKSGRLAPSPVMLARWRTRLAAAALVGVDEVRKRRMKHKGKHGKTIKEERLGWAATIEDAKKLGDLWHPDVLRHTYATNWLATHNDIGKLSELMGNSPKVIKSSYKGLCTQKEAKSYWAITPTKDIKATKLATDTRNA